MSLAAADVSRRTCLLSRQRISADSRRRLRFRGRLGEKVSEPMVPLNLYRLGPRHLKRAVIVFGFVGRKEIRRRRATVVAINAAAPPAEVGLALEFEHVARRLFDLHVHAVTEPKNFPVNRFVAWAVMAVVEFRDQATQPAVVPIAVTAPRAFPVTGDVLGGKRCRGRLFASAVEGRAAGGRERKTAQSGDCGT